MCRVELHSRCTQSSCRVDVQSQVAESSCRVELQSRGTELRYRVEVLTESMYRVGEVLPLYHRFQLQLECFGGLFLDLFDALDPPAPSICPSDYRLLRYRQNRARVKNSASSCFPHCTTTFNYN